MKTGALWVLLAVIVIVVLLILVKVIEFILPFLFGAVGILIVGFLIGFWAKGKS
jgi:hypothetical protein